MHRVPEGRRAHAGPDGLTSFQVRRRPVAGTGVIPDPPGLRLLPAPAKSALSRPGEQRAADFPGPDRLDKPPFGPQPAHLRRRITDAELAGGVVQL
jgi:hypothetical protein